MFMYSHPCALVIVILVYPRVLLTGVFLATWKRLVRGDLAPVSEEGGGGGACSKLFVLADVHRPKYAWVCGPGSSRLLPNWLLFHDACGSSCYSGRVTENINLNCHHLQPLWWKLFHPLIKGTPVEHYQWLWGQHCWRFCQRPAVLRHWPLCAAYGL